LASQYVAITSLCRIAHSVVGSNNEFDAAAATTLATAIAQLTALTNLNFRSIPPSVTPPSIHLPPFLCPLHPRFTLLVPNTNKPWYHPHRHVTNGGLGPRSGQDLGDGVWPVLAALLPRASLLQVPRLFPRLQRAQSYHHHRVLPFLTCGLPRRWAEAGRI
jgi:hypothetical protein